MTHYALLKFAPGTDMDAVKAKFDATFDVLDRELTCISDPVIRLNCVVRDSNYDLMVCLKVDVPEHLPNYLQHPLHVALIDGYKDVILGKVSFDHM